MSDRAQQLHATTDTQIATLSHLIANADESVLRRQCPGREKLGDGTVGALAVHTAENYGRIATFLTVDNRASAEHASGKRSRHRSPRWFRAPGHQTPTHGPGTHNHGERYTADTATSGALIERLSAARDRLKRMADLTDQQLDAVPPKDSFRFCDGQRTLEQVLAALVKHQDRQAQTLTAALAPAP
jgi:hypothetical protein